MPQTQVPPGPSGRLTAPLRFLDYCRDPLGYLTRMAAKYGDVVDFAAGPMPFYMFSHPDAIEEILRRKHRLFKKDAYMEALRPLLGNGLLCSEGEEWRRAGRWPSRRFKPGRSSNTPRQWSTTPSG